MLKVLVTETRTARIGIDILSRTASVESNHYGRLMTEEELLEEAKDVDAILLGGEKLTSRIIDSCEKLKIVARHGAGCDNVDLGAATEHGVLVTNAAEAVTEAVADYTMGLVICLARLIPRANQSLVEGRWEKSGLLGTDVSGKKLGVIGFGRIGAAVCKRAAGFGMSILATDPYVDKKRAEQYGTKLVPLESLLRDSDFVTIHVPLGPETKKLITERELGMMKKGSYLINTARGGIIDEEALYQALIENKIAGAALDVFEQEPLPQDYRLRLLQNVVVTPHIAGNSRETLERIAVTTANDITTALQGGIPKNVVNTQVLRRTGNEPPER